MRRTSQQHALPHHEVGGKITSQPASVSHHTDGGAFARIRPPLRRRPAQHAGVHAHPAPNRSRQPDVLKMVKHRPNNPGRASSSPRPSSPGDGRLSGRGTAPAEGERARTAASPDPRPRGMDPTRRPASRVALGGPVRKLRRTTLDRPVLDRRNPIAAARAREGSASARGTVRPSHSRE